MITPLLIFVVGIVIFHIGIRVRYGTTSVKLPHRRTQTPAPGTNWQALVDSDSYWEARSKFLMTGTLADRDIMLEFVTETRPDLDELPGSPDRLPAAKPRTANANTWSKNILNQVSAADVAGMTVTEYTGFRQHYLTSGGAGGSGQTTISYGENSIIAYGGDQRGSEALGRCPGCNAELPYLRGSRTVLCGDCHREKELAEYDAALYTKWMTECVTPSQMLSAVPMIWHNETTIQRSP